MKQTHEIIRKFATDMTDFMKVDYNREIHVIDITLYKAELSVFLFRGILKVAEELGAEVKSTELNDYTDRVEFTHEGIRYYQLVEKGSEPR